MKRFMKLSTKFNLETALTVLEWIGKITAVLGIIIFSIFLAIVPVVGFMFLLSSSDGLGWEDKLTGTQQVGLFMVISILQAVFWHAIIP